MNQSGTGGVRAGRSIHFFLLMVAALALLTGQRPSASLALAAPTHAQFQGAVSIGPSALDTGNPYIASKSEPKADTNRDASSRASAVAGLLGSGSDRGPLAAPLQYFLRQPRAKLLPSDRIPLLVAPKTSPPFSRS